MTGRFEPERALLPAEPFGGGRRRPPSEVTPNSDPRARFRAITGSRPSGGVPLPLAADRVPCHARPGSGWVCLPGGVAYREALNEKRAVGRATAP